MGALAVVVKVFQQLQGRPPAEEEGFSFDLGGGDEEFTIDDGKLGGEVSPDLLDILVCPLDKGPLDLVDGKWLVNPRNGYRYPIVEGIPVMLIEVGEKYRDPSLIRPAEPTASAAAEVGAGVDADTEVPD
jgi:uncharacterized protein YbaR (Trm112 family)